LGAARAHLPGQPAEPDSPTLGEVLGLVEYGLCSGGRDFEEMVGSARLEAKLNNLAMARFAG
jgi:hypothetical protein